MTCEVVFPPNAQARRHEAPLAPVSRTGGETVGRLVQDSHPLPGRRMAHSPRGGIDPQTLEIHAAELTTSDVGAAPMLPELFDQIPADHTALQERKARYRRGDRAQRSLARITPLRSNHPATMARLSPQEPRRNMSRAGKTIRGIVFPANGCDFRQTAGSATGRKGLRPSGRRVPDPRGHPERLHRAPEFPSLKPSDKSVRAKGKSACHPICATEPCHCIQRVRLSVRSATKAPVVRFVIWPGAAIN